MMKYLSVKCENKFFFITIEIQKLYIYNLNYNIIFLLHLLII